MLEVILSWVAVFSPKFCSKRAKWPETSLILVLPGYKVLKEGHPIINNAFSLSMKD